MKHKEQRLPIFAERFRELQGDMSNTEFAAYLGMSRQTVGFYCNGDRIPDAASLRDIADICNVSTDWLLGLSNVKTANISVKAICEYTGLSLESVDVLHNANIVLTGQKTSEMNQFIQDRLAKEMAKDENKIDLLLSVINAVNEVLSLNDADFLENGRLLITEKLTNYFYKHEIEEAVSSAEKCREYLEDVLVDIETEIERIRSYYDDDAIDLEKGIATDEFLMDADLLLTSVNWGLSSENAKQILRLIALAISGEEDSEENSWLIVTPKKENAYYNAAMKNVKIATNAILLDIQKRILYEQERIGKKYDFAIKQ